MTETADLVRRLYDHVTTTGSLTDADWLRFKNEHRMPPEQCKQVLVQIVGHLCTMAGELTQEANRLSIALVLRRR